MYAAGHLRAGSFPTVVLTVSPPKQRLRLGSELGLLYIVFTVGQLTFRVWAFFVEGFFWDPLIIAVNIEQATPVL